MKKGLFFAHVVQKIAMEIWKTKNTFVIPASGRKLFSKSLNLALTYGN